MSDIVEPDETKQRRKQFGRHGKPHRIYGLDLRSSVGRSYSRYFHALAAEFPAADIARLKTLAAHKAQLEKLQGDALTLGFWEAARAGDRLVPLARLIEKMEAALRADKAASAPPEPSPASAVIASIRARREVSDA